MFEIQKASIEELQKQLLEANQIINKMNQGFPMIRAAQENNASKYGANTQLVNLMKQAEKWLRSYDDISIHSSAR